MAQWVGLERRSFRKSCSVRNLPLKSQKPPYWVFRGNFMGQRKFTLYKDVKIGCGWQKVKAAFYSNGKIKPNIVIYKGKEQEHPEGAYYVNDRGKWIFAEREVWLPELSLSQDLHKPRNHLKEKA
jgi:hypothetical protein